MKIRTLISLIASLSTLTIATAANATLLAYYSFDTLGTITTDSSGNGRTLTNNGATIGTGKFGTGGASFNGSSDFLFRNDASLGLTSGDFSVAFWYQSPSVNFSAIAGKNNTNSNQGWDVSVNGFSTLSANLEDTLAGTTTVARPADDASNYHHVVMQRSGLTALNIFIDGVLTGTDVISASDFAATSNAFALGARNVSSGGTAGSTGGANFYTGLIDELYIYDVALSQTEINNLISDNDINGATVSAPATGLMLTGGLLAFRLRTRKIKA